MESPAIRRLIGDALREAGRACAREALDEGSVTWGGHIGWPWLDGKYEDGDPVVRRAMDIRLLGRALDDDCPIDLREPFLGPAIELLHVVKAEVDLDAVEPFGRALDAPTERFLDLALSERGARSGDEMDIVRTFGRWLARRYEDGDPEVRGAMGLVLAKEAIYSIGTGSLALDRPFHARIVHGLSGYVVPSENSGLPHGWDEAWNGGGHILGTFRSRRTDFEVVLYDRGGPVEPHIHLRRPRSPRTPDVCVSLVRPAYVPHGDATRELGPGQVEDLAVYLGGSVESGPYSDSTRWAAFLGEWDYFRDEDHRATEMPDYLGLNRRDGESA